MDAALSRGTNGSWGILDGNWRVIVGGWSVTDGDWRWRVAVGIPFCHCDGGIFVLVFFPLTGPEVGGLWHWLSKMRARRVTSNQVAGQTGPFV